jgi:hypothetical protein
VKAEIAAFKGKVNLFAKNLDNGETYAVGADVRVRTASTIKIAVMVEAFARVAAGKAKWTDELVLTKKKKVSGSGVLQELSDGLHFTLRDGVNLMMLVISPAASKEMIDLMKREQEHYAIGRSLGDVPMATKYGALDHLRSAIGIIYSKKGRIAMAITCDEIPEVDWSVDNPGYLLMSRLSLILTDRLVGRQ